MRHWSAALLLSCSVAASSAHAAEPMPRGERIVYETLGGLGGAVVGGLVGYGVGMATMGDGEFGPIFALAFAAFPGAILGMPSGVYLTGEACGGDGNYWATLGGTLVGAIVPTAFAFLASDNDDLWPVHLLLWTTLPLAGGVIGYELSQAEPGSSTPAARLWLSPTEGGFYTGLSGSFR